MEIVIKIQIRKIRNKIKLARILRNLYLSKRKNTNGRTKIKKNFILNFLNLLMHQKYKRKSIY